MPIIIVPMTLTRHLAAITLLLAVGGPAVAAVNPRPNLIMILTADQGCHDVGFSDCKDIPPPNLDSIASSGVRFSSGYVSYSVCSPVRAGLLTGHYEQRFGHEHNPQWQPENVHSGLPLTETTMADTLGKAGYHSGIIGKWHLGAHPDLHPLKRGFVEFFGFLGGGHRYLPEELTLIRHNQENLSPDTMQLPASDDAPKAKPQPATNERSGAAALSPTNGTFSGQAAQVSISPLLVGNNVWMNPRDAVWNASRGAGLKIIRIGGGAYDRRMPSNAQLTEWVNRIKAMGAKPMIQVSQSRSAADAAEVVRHFNITTNNHVEYWNIGNEPWLQRGRPRDRVALARTVADYVKPIASAMKDVDPTIKIFAPDECDYFDDMYNALLGGSADITGKDEHGRYYIDGISWHRYVGGDLATAGAKDFLNRIQRTRARVDYVNQLHGRAGAAALQWGIGEFNASGGEGVFTFANGQMFGQIYGYLMKYGGAYATTWSMYENGGRRSGSDFSFLNTDMTPRPSYYHMQMISQNFSGRYADGRCNVSTLRTYGAVDVDKIAVMLINVGNRQTSNVRLNNDPIDGSCQVNIDAGVPVTVAQAIGGQTTLVLVFNRQGQLTKRITYADGSSPKEEIFDP